jgi:predicted amidohydrolase
VAPVRQLEVSAAPRRASRLSVYEIDLETVRSLRREVPVARDERRECYAAWLE